MLVVFEVRARVDVVKVLPACLMVITAHHRVLIGRRFEVIEPHTKDMRE